MGAIAMMLLNGTLGLFKKYWKFIMVALAVAVIFFFVKGQIAAFEGRAFNRGVQATLNKMKGEVVKRDVYNRAIEKTAQDGLDGFAGKKMVENNTRTAAEIKKQDRIATVVDSVPMWKSDACSVTPQVLEDRNAIRALGPKAAEGEAK